MKKLETLATLGLKGVNDLSEQNTFCTLIESVNTKGSVLSCTKDVSLFSENSAVDFLLQSLALNESVKYCDGNYLTIDSFLYKILQIYGGRNKLHTIIITDELKESESRLYKESGVWIITMNYAIQMLVRVFQSRGWDTKVLARFAEGFSFEISASAA